jgi:hypothetical protein
MMSMRQNGGINAMPLSLTCQALENEADMFNATMEMAADCGEFYVYMVVRGLL